MRGSSVDLYSNHSNIDVYAKHYTNTILHISTLLALSIHRRIFRQAPYTKQNSKPQFSDEPVQKLLLPTLLLLKLPTYQSNSLAYENCSYHHILLCYRLSEQSLRPSCLPFLLYARAQTCGAPLGLPKNNILYPFFPLTF